MKKLILIGLCMWIPIWAFSYTPLAATMLNDKDNTFIAVALVFVMVIGIILTIIGMVKNLVK